MHREEQEKISLVQEGLLSWSAGNGRKFKWRQSGLSSYEYIIAEVLLQRTRAETVSNFYENFIKDFPHWESLASAPIEVIERYLTPIGLYKQRASRLQELAKEMVIRRGQLPDQRNELESIPFMGQYTANAVELIVHGKRKPLLDVNMARVAERLFQPRKLADIRYDPHLQSLAHELVNHENSKELNWAILDFAALICVARKPKCDICFLKTVCNYYNGTYTS